MFDYHQMTMGQPRDTPQQRKQYLVICLIMAGYGLHSAINAGLFAPLDVKRGTFPGGEFAYKSMTKDYAASGGTLRMVAHDLGMTLHADDEPIGDDVGDLLHAVFFDDERLVPGGKTRFAGGALLSAKSKVDERKAAKRRLMVDANERIAKLVPEEGGTIMSKNVMYEVGKLPKVEAAMAHHPYSGGAWSAMLQSFKIIPKFRKYAEEHGESGKSPVVIVTCSAEQKMCTYYVPLAKRDEFFMGKPTTEEYAKEFANAGVLERFGISFDDTWVPYLGNVIRGLRRAVGLGGISSTKKTEL